MNIMQRFVSIAVVLISAGIVWPGQQDDARALVLTAIKAVGGEGRLAKHNSVTIKQKGTYYGLGDGDGLPFTAVSSYDGPDKFRMEMDLEVFNNFFVLNGDKGWNRSGDETRELTKDELTLEIYNQRYRTIVKLLPLKDKAFHLKMVGEAKVGDQFSRVVQVTRKDYPDVKLYFAKNTGMLVKSEFRTKAEAEDLQQVNQTAEYSDFRDVDGVKVPHKIAIKRDDKIYAEVEVTELKTGKLDPNLFGTPNAD
jgi:hypothetical protein